jgi:hypothetical protein
MSSFKWSHCPGFLRVGKQPQYQQGNNPIKEYHEETPRSKKVETAAIRLAVTNKLIIREFLSYQTRRPNWLLTISISVPIS